MRRPRLSFRNVVIAAALVQAGLLLGLLIYLAASDRALVVSIPSREERWRAEASAGLVIPVAGVRAAELKNTYGAARSGGRAHKGVDIFAAKGTPVVAAAAGVIVKRDSNAVGGVSVYQRDLDARTIYYYAHLNGWRAGLKEGDLVRQGEVIGYVGSTGNVSGSPHLHFAVFTVTDPNRWWKGRDLNPYTLLRPPASAAR
ncbi:MAG TPA: M23 family metallopeptidase [Longimicrobium sp.]|jgi:murein DD-endopeptidase MepM/ murein hydrolase activator NlpD|uniref:M23 family metallopeptidase n=1 Tax=Longimicrobium sp. TaxID=2029185 RepID=UPI002EDB1FE0